MLFRFCLNGFLRNQRYFDPFLLLAFREKGLSFSQIGLLIGFREICINVFEIPSGIGADLWGRRTAMILSCTAYIISFALFWAAPSFFLLLPAMLTFALGRVFRTGPNAAILFEWFDQKGIEDNDRTCYLALTRYWARMGSALSVLIAATFVFFGGSYNQIFLLTIPPYILAIVNILGYSTELVGQRREQVSFRHVVEQMVSTIKEAFGTPPIRRILLESMTYGGLYRVSKDYLQPLLRDAALALIILTEWKEPQRVAVLVGVVYFSLHLLSAGASWKANSLREKAGSHNRASRMLWWASLLLYAFLALSAGLGKEWVGLAIASFVALEVAQNLWRPVLLSRLSESINTKGGAGMLSVESQTKSFFAMLVAPLIGFSVDLFGLWTVGAVGFAVTLPCVLAQSKEVLSQGGEFSKPNWPNSLNVFEESDES